MFVPATVEYYYGEYILPKTQHGQANTRQQAVQFRGKCLRMLSLNGVQCIHCLEWPPQAAVTNMTFLLGNKYVESLSHGQKLCY